MIINIVKTKKEVGRADLCLHMGERKRTSASRASRRLLRTPQALLTGKMRMTGLVAQARTNPRFWGALCSNTKSNSTTVGAQNKVPIDQIFFPGPT